MTVTDEAPAERAADGSRRPQVLDAAIAQLAVYGERGLTHRRIEEAARIPAGTAGNHFRTREALVLGVFAEVQKRRRAAFKQLTTRYMSADQRPTLNDVAELLSGYITDATATPPTAASALAHAHHVLGITAYQYPDLRILLTDTRQMETERLHQLLKLVSPTIGRRHSGMVADYVAGVIGQQLTSPTEHFNPHHALTTLLAALR